MNKLSYFRELHKNEQKNDLLAEIKKYIHRNNNDIINKFHHGFIKLPSPFLLDELEWSLDIKNNQIKNIIYNLKIQSREFYKTIFEKNDTENYNIFLKCHGKTLMHDILINLIKLKKQHNKSDNNLISNIKEIYYEIYTTFV